MWSDMCSTAFGPACVPSVDRHASADYTPCSYTPPPPPTKEVQEHTSAASHGVHSSPGVSLAEPLSAQIKRPQPAGDASFRISMSLQELAAIGDNMPPLGTALPVFVAAEVTRRDCGQLLLPGAPL